jgi:hypothetical protein
MKRILLFVFVMVCAFSTMAQDKEKIVGKWKVVVMYDADMYLDITKDSIHMNKPLDESGKLTKHQTDSMLNQIKAVMKEMFKDAYFEFSKDMTYSENSSMQGDRTGTYSIDESTKTITIKKERESKVTGEVLTNEEKIKYHFKNNRLIFTEDGDNGHNIEFEKQ